MTVSGTTYFCVASVVIQVITITTLLVVKIRHKPQFGTNLAAGNQGNGVQNVQVGVDAAGQPVVQQVMNPNVAHWSHLRSTVLIMPILQFILVVLLVAALANDSWTKRQLQYGLVTGHEPGYPSSPYSCSSEFYDAEQLVSCHTLIVAGAFVLAFALIASIAAALLALKNIFIALVDQAWATWMDTLAQVQLIALIGATFIWALSPHIILTRYVEDATLSSSWALCLVCFLMSILLARYYRQSIQFRPSGLPIGMAAVQGAPVAAAYAQPTVGMMQSRYGVQSHPQQQQYMQLQQAYASQPMNPYQQPQQHVTPVVAVPVGEASNARAPPRPAQSNFPDVAKPAPEQ